MDRVHVLKASSTNEALRRGRTTAVPGRNLQKLVVVSFGLLCMLQAALNISLRLLVYSSKSETAGVPTSCKNLTAQTDRLKGFDQYFQDGWVYLQPSLYYISSIQKSWLESREFCLQKGADLMIINSEQEQAFIRKFQGIIWIGLTDKEAEGIWKWVDGAMLTKSYWRNGEPNSYRGQDEDCVEVKTTDNLNCWNDVSCKSQNFWICEKTVG